MEEGSPYEAPDAHPVQNDPPQAEQGYISQRDRDMRQWAMFLHLSTFAGVLVPVLGFVAPIVIWQIKKDEFPEIDEHGRVVVNWLISAVIYGFVSILLVFLLIGIPLIVAVSICSVVFPVIGGIKANQGELWPYPLSLRIV